MGRFWEAEGGLGIVLGGPGGGLGEGSRSGCGAELIVSQGGFGGLVWRGYGVAWGWEGRWEPRGQFWGAGGIWGQSDVMASELQLSAESGLGRV